MRDSLVLTSFDKLRIFVSSTIKECAKEREAAYAGIKATNHEPVLFEKIGARPYPPRNVYLSRLRASDIVVAIYKEKYGFVDEASGMTVSGLEDEYRNARKWGLPLLVYIQREPGSRDARLAGLIDEIMASGVTIASYDDPNELNERVRDDVTAVVVQRFLDAGTQDSALRQSPAEAIVFAAHGIGALVSRTKVLQTLSTLVAANRFVRVSGPAGIGKTVLLSQFAHERGHPIIFAEGLGPKELFGVLTNRVRRLGADIAEQFATFEGARTAFVSAWRDAQDCTLLLDGSPHVDLVKRAIEEAGITQGRRTLVYTSREIRERAGDAIFSAPRFDRQEIVQFLTNAGQPIDEQLVATLDEETQGNPLLVRQRVLKPGASTADLWRTLPPSARELASYIAIANTSLSVADLLALRGDSAYGPQHLADDIETMPSFVIGTGAGYKIVHGQIRAELLSTIRARPEQFQYFASRLGQFFEDGARVILAYLLFSEARNPAAKELVKQASFEAARSGDQLASNRILVDLLKFALEDKDYREAVHAALALAQTQEVMGDASSAADYLRRAEVLADSADDDTKLAVREAALGFKARRELTPESLEELRNLKKELVTENRVWQSGRICTELSVAYINLRDYAAAEQESREALKLFELVNDTYGIDIAKRNLASALVSQSNKQEEAQRVIAEVQQSTDAQSSKRHRAWLCNLLVRQNRQAGLPEQAKAFAEEAISIGRELGDELLVATNLIGLANVFSDLKQFKQAIETYQAAAIGGQRCGRRDVEAHASQLIASAYNEMPDDEAFGGRSSQLAESHARHAIGLLRDTAGKDPLWRSLEALGEALQGQGRKREAAEAYFEGASITRELEKWKAFESLTMTASYVIIDGNVPAYVRGIRVAFGLSEEIGRTTRTKHLFDPIARMIDVVPRDMAIPIMGVHFGAMFKDLPDLVARHLFEAAFSVIFTKQRAQSFEQWRLLFPGLILAAAAGRVLTRLDITRIALEISRLVPGIHVRPIPGGGAHWFIQLNLSKQVAITITPLDDEKHSDLACLLLALFFKGYEDELSKDVFGGINLRSELNIVVGDVDSTPPKIRDEVRSAMGQSSVQTSRLTDIEQDTSRMPTYVFLRNDFFTNLQIGKGRGGNLQVLIGLTSIEIAYRLMSGQVDLEVLKPKMASLIRGSIS